LKRALRVRDSESTAPKGKVHPKALPKSFFRWLQLNTGAPNPDGTNEPDDSEGPIEIGKRPVAARRIRKQSKFAQRI